MTDPTAPVALSDITFHDFEPGSDPWLQHRRQTLNGSEAPIAMGVHGKRSRRELLEVTAGIAEPAKLFQRILDDGHKIEAALRPVVETLLGGPVEPACVSAAAEGLTRRLSASLDGFVPELGMVWECKSLNKEIRGLAEEGDFPLHVKVQMEQGMMLTGARKGLFSAGELNDDGGLVEGSEIHIDYRSDPELRARIIESWRLFEQDVDRVLVGDVEISVSPSSSVSVREAPDTPEIVLDLVASSGGKGGPVSVRHNLGQVLSLVVEEAETFPDTFETDDDMACGRSLVSWCEDIENRCEDGHDRLLSGMSDVQDALDELGRIKDAAAKARIKLKKDLDASAARRKADIVRQACGAFEAYTDGYTDNLGGFALEMATKAISEFAHARVFEGALKGKRALKPMAEAVEHELVALKLNVRERIDAVVRSAKLFDNVEAPLLNQLFLDRKKMVLEMDPQAVEEVIELRISRHEAEVERRAAQKAAEQPPPAAEKAAGEPPPAEPRNAPPSTTKRPGPDHGFDPARLETLVTVTATVRMPAEALRRPALVRSRFESALETAASASGGSVHEYAVDW